MKIFFYLPALFLLSSCFLDEEADTGVMCAAFGVNGASPVCRVGSAAKCAQEGLQFVANYDDLNQCIRDIPAVREIFREDN